MKYTDYAFDIECFPNLFTIIICRISDLSRWTFIIAPWKNEGKELNYFLNQIAASNGRMVGYNNITYDYPMVHLILQMNGNVNNQVLYQKSQMLITRDFNDHSQTIWDNDRLIPQLDLMKVHHFDNKAKLTSLKLLEFNMRMDSVEECELPFDLPVPPSRVSEVLSYNDHDVTATVDFYHHSKELIEFREELTEKYKIDFSNFNDTKIGAEIVKLELEKHKIKVSKYNQSIRDKIKVRDIIFPCIKFRHKEFNDVLTFFMNTVIDANDIKGFFKKSQNDEVITSATINGFTYEYGAGGIHGSVTNRIIESDDSYVIVDVDYQSFYPRISIEYETFPEHLGKYWCEVMKFMFDERLRVGKKTSIGGAYKLGLNGSYGKSNDIHSPFYDPQYTMTITINGQFLISMLCELLIDNIPDLEMIFVNTDGICCRIPRTHENYLYELCEYSDKHTGLTLEFQTYKMLAIRDVNNYIGVTYD